MFQPKVSLPASKAEIHRSKTLFVMVESRNPSTNQMMLPTAGGNDEIPADIATEAVSSDASMPYPHRRPVMTAKLNANDVQLADLDDHESADLSLQQLPSSRVLSDCTASVDKKNSNINDTSRGGSRLQAFLTTGRGESAVMNDLESESDGDDERD
jgi:hypothetical protein